MKCDKCLDCLCVYNPHWYHLKPKKNVCKREQYLLERCIAGLLRQVNIHIRIRIRTMTHLNYRWMLSADLLKCLLASNLSSAYGAYRNLFAVVFRTFGAKSLPEKLSGTCTCRPSIPYYTVLYHTRIQYVNKWISGVLA